MKIKETNSGVFSLTDKQNILKLNALCDGEIISVEDVGDIVFSEKMIGDGYSIIPSDGRIYSPVDGRISEVAATKHAYYITLEDDNKILIHIGEDTLLLNGEGFTVNTEKGSKIKKGDLLGTVDLDYMKQENHTIVISTILLFNNKFEMNVINYPGKDAKANETLACEIEYKPVNSELT